MHTIQEKNTFSNTILHLHQEWLYKQRNRGPWLLTQSGSEVVREAILRQPSRVSFHSMLHTCKKFSFWKYHLCQRSRFCGVPPPFFFLKQGRQHRMLRLSASTVIYLYFALQLKTLNSRSVNHRRAMETLIVFSPSDRRKISVACLAVSKYGLFKTLAYLRTKRTKCLTWAYRGRDLKNIRLINIIVLLLYS